MSINSKSDICNLALGHLGNLGTVTNIDSPTTSKERTFNLWYDISRQSLLKRTMPNFALARKLVSELVVTIPFGYAYAFEYPIDCLKVLGLGNIQDTGNYVFSVEGNVIYTDDEWAAGLQLRYIKDVEDISLFSPEFKILLSYLLASNVALEITQDLTKKKLLEEMLPKYIKELSSVNAQENQIVRISNSLFHKARFVSNLTRIPAQK